MITLVYPSVEIISHPGKLGLKTIEMAGRTCYKSEEKITPDSYTKFIKSLMDRGHLSVIEHMSATAKIICDRGVTHELVRHRLASYSQESTRYCNYKNRGLVFIIPSWCKNIFPGKYHDFCSMIRYNDPEREWMYSMFAAKKAYLNLLEMEWSPEKARTVLPNSLKTEIVITANMREWRHIFALRLSSKAHPQMREIMQFGLHLFKPLFSPIFDDLTLTD